jgi:ABC-2 type transport system permease protein
LLLSMLLPSRRLAGSTAGLVLVASFFLTMLARDDPDMHSFSQLLPLDYYQSGDAIRGLNLQWFCGLLAVAAVLAALAWWAFERRDLRVSGEGSWRWPFGRVLKAPH